MFILPYLSDAINGDIVLYGKSKSSLFLQELNWIQDNITILQRHCQEHTNFTALCRTVQLPGVKTEGFFKIPRSLRITRDHNSGPHNFVPFSCPACICVPVGDVTALFWHSAALLHSMKHCDKDRCTKKRSTNLGEPFFRTDPYAVYSAEHLRMCLGHLVLGGSVAPANRFMSEAFGHLLVTATPYGS